MKAPVSRRTRVPAPRSGYSAVVARDAPRSPPASPRASPACRVDVLHHARIAVEAVEVVEVGRRRTRASRAAASRATAPVARLRFTDVSPASAASCSAWNSCASAVDDLVQVAVHDRVDLVQRQVDPVIGDAALRKIVRADALAAVAASRSATCDAPLPCSAARCRSRSSRREASTDIACARLRCCERSSWHSTTRPVGRCVMRTAESVLLTCWPPAPDARNVSMRMSAGLIVMSAIGSASGNHGHRARGRVDAALRLGLRARAARDGRPTRT